MACFSAALLLASCAGMNGPLTPSFQELAAVDWTAHRPVDGAEVREEVEAFIREGLIGPESALFHWTDEGPK